MLMMMVVVVAMMVMLMLTMKMTIESAVRAATPSMLKQWMSLARAERPF